MTIKYVVGFAFNKEKTKVLLIKKTKPDWQAGQLNGIDGKIESYDKNPHQSMTREFLEECNLETKATDWKHFATINSDYFELECFAGFFNIDFLENYQTTTEEVILSDIQYLFDTQFSQCISNLKWLISICLDNDFNRIFINSKYD